MTTIYLLDLVSTRNERDWMKGDLQKYMYPAANQVDRFYSHVTYNTAAGTVEPVCTETSLSACT